MGASRPADPNRSPPSTPPKAERPQDGPIKAPESPNKAPQPTKTQQLPQKPHLALLQVRDGTFDQVAQVVGQVPVAGPSQVVVVGVAGQAAVVKGPGQVVDRVLWGGGGGCVLNGLGFFLGGGCGGRGGFWGVGFGFRVHEAPPRPACSRSCAPPPLPRPLKQNTPKTNPRTPDLFVLDRARHHLCNERVVQRRVEVALHGQGLKQELFVVVLAGGGAQEEHGLAGGLGGVLEGEAGSCFVAVLERGGAQEEHRVFDQGFGVGGVILERLGVNGLKPARFGLGPAATREAGGRFCVLCTGCQPARNLPFECPMISP